MAACVLPIDHLIVFHNKRVNVAAGPAAEAVYGVAYRVSGKGLTSCFSLPGCCQFVLASSYVTAEACRRTDSRLHLSISVHGPSLLYIR
jgi:hypothetical protein